MNSQVISVSGQNQMNQRQSTCRKSVQLFLLLRTLAVAMILSTEIPTVSAQISKAMIYLSKYGYLPASVSNPTSSNLITQEALSDAISEFQSFAGLNITGVLDDETLRLMATPRCGVKDKVGHQKGYRGKRYIAQGSRWKIHDLNYRISKYPTTLKKKDVDEVIRRAFEVWSEHTNLKFRPKSTGSVHIEIKFVRLEHGDGDPFDGRGGVLAHAFFPIYGGDVHFDDDEYFTIASYKGTNLFQVAAHEIGHALGLAHSTVHGALMAPYYKGYDPGFELHPDDIAGIQFLYGPKTESRTTTEMPNVIYDQSELCFIPNIDTIFTDEKQTTYVFKGDKYWKLTATATAKGYPKRISEGWPGLPSNIDSAFTYKNGKTYFFKGDRFWRYTGRKMDLNYPKYISDGFPGIPSNIDAVLVWSGNGKIYFFKGSKFWKFDPSSIPAVRSTYPKSISSWKGIPNNIDAAMQYSNGYTYFFKGDAYWRFDDRNFEVDTDEIAFPRPAKQWWFGCKGNKDTLGNRTANIEEFKLAKSSQKESGSQYDFLNIDAGSNDTGNGSTSLTLSTFVLVLASLTFFA